MGLTVILFDYCIVRQREARSEGEVLMAIEFVTNQTWFDLLQERKSFLKTLNN
jgi:hypothetical protein